MRHKKAENRGGEEENSAYVLRDRFWEVEVCFGESVGASGQC